MLSDPKVIVALDYSNQSAANSLLELLDPKRCRVKIGKELFTYAGPVFVESVVKRGFDVFLDLKFHDIPNTVAKACLAAAELGVWMINVHALGGRKMMEAAREELEKLAQRPHLIAVTILTSHTQEDIAAVGLTGSVEENVLRLVKLAHASGLDGVVCSPLETSRIRGEIGEEFLLVTPGVRPIGSHRGDQARVMTPRDALLGGASYLVIGRPITAADNPMSALLTIEKDIADI